MSVGEQELIGEPHLCAHRGVVAPLAFQTMDFL